MPTFTEAGLCARYGELGKPGLPHKCLCVCKLFYISYHSKTLISFWAISGELRSNGKYWMFSKERIVDGLLYNTKKNC